MNEILLDIFREIDCGRNTGQLFKVPMGKDAVSTTPNSNQDTPAHLHRMAGGGSGGVRQWFD